jgi:ABC-type transport system substrate-binding protein
MSHSPHRRHLHIAVLVTALLLPLLLPGLGWLASDLLAQNTSKKEEEDPTPVKPKDRPKGEEEEDGGKPRKVIRVEEDPKKPGALTEAVDLVTAARQTKNPVVKEFLNSIAEPHDLVVAKSAEYRVEPVDRFLGNPPRFANQITLKVYKEGDWQIEKNWSVRSSALTGIRYYEQIVPTRVDEFLDASNKSSLSRTERLRMAVMALAAALNFHESARLQGKRQGEEFEPIEAQLRQKLLDVQLAQLQALVDASDWDNAFARAKQLAEGHSRPDEQEKIAGPLAKALGDAVESGKYKEEQLLELLRRLRQLEERFPTTTVTAPFRSRLRTRAEGFFEKAKEMLAEKSVTPARRKEALSLLKNAEDICPSLPGLHDFRLTLDNQIAVLRVGVRELPQNLVPGVAWTDSEKQAVELLFESLVKLTYQPNLGQRYSYSLSEGRPHLIPRGRQFNLIHDAFWSNDKPITAADVRHTVRLLKNPKWGGYQHCWEGLIEDAKPGIDPFQVNVTLKQGILDPLSLMTFKVLPADPWPDQGLTPGAAEVRFSKELVTSGPYQLKGEDKTDRGRPFVRFVANPNYAARAGRADLPRIREIQFVLTTDPGKDLQDGLLDLVADLPTDQVKAALTARSITVLPPQPNRRFWFLAVNHRHRELRTLELRKALAHAINRDKILDDVFRAEPARSAHRPLTGPYPPGSWACNEDLGYSLDLARSSIKEAEEKGAKGSRLTLKYANDDPRNERAMKALAAQVQQEIGVKLELQPLEPHALHDAVEVSHEYDLAYYHYDYPSESYWLWPLFDPDNQATEARGSNYLGYTNDGDLEKQFGEVMSHCDFEQVQKATRVMHGILFQKMPLIPLWQLDTHIAVHTDLKTTGIDPLLLFTDVDQWRLEKK